MELTVGWAFLAAVAAERLVELAWATRNTRALVAAGGRIAPRDGTGLLLVLHVATFAGIAVERWLGARIGGTSSLVAALLFGVATVGRAWTLHTLGRRWTIRVVTVPGETPVARGPYRFVRHPNYLVVLAEMLALPALFHAWWTVALGTLPHLLALLYRVGVEDAAWRVTTLQSAPRP